jgi:hypothetical protein
MTGTGGRLGRIAAIVAALAIGLLLLAAREARAGFYTVAQCGWGVGADATWSETSAGAGLEPENHCNAPGARLSDGLGSFTIAGGGLVPRGQYGAWRWAAPAGTGIVAASGRWWHSLRGGFAHSLGTDGSDGTFAPFATAGSGSTPVVPSAFAVPFPAPRAAFEDRLLCPRDSEGCFLSEPSSTALSSLMLRIEDAAAPQPASSGELLAGGWRRGDQGAVVSATDAGSGLTYDELRIDGRTVSHADLPCAEADAGGVVATRMQPCPTSATSSVAVATADLDDGPHEVNACAADFAEDVTCAADRQILVDNTAPGRPRGVTVAATGSHGSLDDFDVRWTDPDQGSASPVAAALWRVTGPDGFDTDVATSEGRGIEALGGLAVPHGGAYVLRLWLRDEAGNSDSEGAVRVTLRDGAEAGAPAGGHGGRRGGRGGGRGAHGGGRKGRRGGGPGRGGGRDGAARLLVHLRYAPGHGRPAAVRTGTLTVPFGSAPTVAGRLVDARGVGIAGRRVRVVARPWRGALAASAPATLTTGKRGGFELALAPGPSRRVVVRLAGEGAAAPERHLDLRVRTGVSLSATPTALATGQEVHLSGRVRCRGARLPRPGKLVAIQYLEAATGSWRPVLVVRSDRRGRFRAGYRFRYVSATARIHLRATALAEDRWPYAPGSSAPVTVDVDGR